MRIQKLNIYLKGPVSEVKCGNGRLAYLQYIDQKWDIDDFSKTSRLIFDMQEEKYASSGGYDLFSMLTLSFI